MQTRPPRTDAIPVWAWLDGQAEPVEAAEFWLEDGGGRLAYLPSYRGQPGAFAFDPLKLPLTSRSYAAPVDRQVHNALLDACPSGYGADLIRARHDSAPTDLDLLELGPGDSVGAIEVCREIERKLAFRAPSLSELARAAAELAEEQNPSRALRQVVDDVATSAGGERPKATIEDSGVLWLAKMQARGDLPALPEKEFVVMGLAGDLGLRIPRIRLERLSGHAVYLVERFDRWGDPARPCRRAYASAKTVLDLSAASVQGDQRRSYLVLADQMARWGANSTHLEEDKRELWKRMCFNALVGNRDDHPANHGLVREGGAWRLSPAFDVTPIPFASQAHAQDEEIAHVLRLAVGRDGSAIATPMRLMESAGHFGLDVEEAGEWLQAAAQHVHRYWAERLSKVGVEAWVIDGSASAFRLSRHLAERPEVIEQIVEALSAQSKQRRRRGLAMR
jgi:serine/threonine-protein kinase HipA